MFRSLPLYFTHSLAHYSRLIDNIACYSLSHLKSACGRIWRSGRIIIGANKSRVLKLHYMCCLFVLVPTVFANKVAFFAMAHELSCALGLLYQ